MATALAWQFYRYYAREMLDDTVGIVEQERKSMADLILHATMDSFPLPFYSFNPSAMLKTPLLPDLKLMPYGEFSVKSYATGALMYSSNFIPFFAFLNRPTGNKLYDELSARIIRKRYVTPRDISDIKFKIKELKQEIAEENKGKATKEQLEELQRLQIELLEAERRNPDYLKRKLIMNTLRKANKNLPYPIVPEKIKLGNEVIELEDLKYLK
jgi:hypothetical protein